MANIDLTFYNRFVPGEPPGVANNRLLANVFGGTPAQFVSPANAGDTLFIQLFLLGESSGVYPYRCDRYPGISTLVRLRAQGNNTIYATSGAGTELVPVTGFTVTRQSTGSASANTNEVHRVKVTDMPLTGTFTLSWSGGTIQDGGIGPVGTTAPIPINATTAQIHDAIFALPGYDRGNGQDNSSWKDGLIITGQLPDFTITFGVVVDSDRGTLPLVVVNQTNTRWAYGWSLSVPLTAGNFTDLFITTNSPAFAEVLVEGEIVAQFQLISSIAPGAPPAADFIASATNATPGSQIQFTDLSSNAPTSWAWDFGDPASGGANTSTVRNPSHTYATAGTYTVQLTATNANGSNLITKTDLIVISAIVGNPPIVVVGVVYDGDHGQAWAVEVVRPERAFSETYSIVYRQRWRQARVNWAALGNDSQCPYDGSAFLVDEGPLQDVGGADLVEWERVWAQTPATIVEYEVMNYTWQIQGTLNGAPVITSFPLTVTAKVTRTFHHTGSPGNISLARLPRVVAFAGVIYNFNGFYNIGDNQEVIVRDDTIRRWMGNIWEKTHATFIHKVT